MSLVAEAVSLTATVVCRRPVKSYALLERIVSVSLSLVVGLSSRHMMFCMLVPMFIATDSCHSYFVPAAATIRVIREMK